jgi:hypothetical protein
VAPLLRAVMDGAVIVVGERQHGIDVPALDHVDHLMIELFVDPAHVSGATEVMLEEVAKRM